jgi:non-specific serine/threonine protein kinase/serine/threonine-protein kinase
MTTEQWREVEQVLAVAMDLPEAERCAYLDRICEGRPAIRSEVDSLLAAYLEAGDFIESAIASEISRDAPLPAPLISRRIGPYRLIRELGRGGMATVYLGQRDDGQFSKEVAVKLIGAVTPSPESLRRFEEERQILATLEHPNIVRLLDGGVTEDGLQYIIMEYIEGLPIDEYCERKGLKLEERLKLFQTICSAVHFAHQRLVLHRDIKPGNILVTAEGQPKLLDFGIAKILDPVLDSSLNQATLTLMRAMTPDYASPEQLQGGVITTSSDVYSLGVLLYELLTGKRPYRLAGATLSETLRIVCEQDPERPSGTRPELRGDLDAIVLKAMRKEPSQRYTSAEEFSSDIGRYLSNWPVLARRGSFRYVVRKFVARHKLAVSVSAVATVLTLVGIAGVIAEARVARAERGKAERRFNDVRKLASSVLFEMNDGIANLPGSTAVRRLLVTRALEYLDSLAKEAQGDASLQLDLALAYVRVGDVQGGPTNGNLGDIKGAFASYEKARIAIQAVLARNPDLTQGLIQLADLNGRFAHVYLDLRDYPHALEAAKAELSGWEAIARRSPENKDCAYGMASAHFSVAEVLERTKPDEALSEFQAALKIHEELLGASPQSAREQRNLALDHKYLCHEFEESDLAKAAEHCQLAVDLDEKRVAANPGDLEAKQDLAYSLSQSGTIYDNKNDFPAAFKSFSRSLLIRQSVVDADPQNARARTSLIYPHLALGNVLTEMGRVGEAIIEYRMVVSLGEALMLKGNIGVRENVALAYKHMGEIEAGFARTTPASSPKRLDHQRAACTNYGHAQDLYRENERRGTASQSGRKEALKLAHDMQVCAH